MRVHDNPYWQSIRRKKQRGEIRDIVRALPPLTGWLLIARAFTWLVRSRLKRAAVAVMRSITGKDSGG